MELGEAGGISNAGISNESNRSMCLRVAGHGKSHQSALRPPDPCSSLSLDEIGTRYLAKRSTVDKVAATLMGFRDQLTGRLIPNEKYFPNIHTHAIRIEHAVLDDLPYSMSGCCCDHSMDR